MKNRYWLVVILFFLCNTLFPFFVFAEDGEQPAACGGPTKEMSLYFDFQNEMRSVLFNSDANEKLLTVGNSKGWLFTEGTLKLSSDVTAMDLVVNGIVGHIASIISSAMTSYVLIALASSSTIGSTVNSLRILFRDKPIVRDYREMMNIETKLFDVAFFRSQQVNLTHSIEGKMLDDLGDVIKKYRNLGLLEDGKENIQTSATMSDILTDLVLMNAAMKHFILYCGSEGLDGSDRGARVLLEYNGCFGGNGNGYECVRDAAVLKFDKDAIEQLRMDYSGVGGFGSCNQYANNFGATISKGRNNSTESVKLAMKDRIDAHSRLKEALIGKGVGKDSVHPCEDLSEYELAQLRAYWGPDWECGNGVSAGSIVNTVKDFQKNKEAMRKVFEGVKTQLKESAKSKGDENERVEKDISNSKTTTEKSQKWREIFGTGVSYNPEFSWEMYAEYEDIYKSVMDDYSFSQFNASAADLGVMLGKIQGLVNQVDEVVNAVGEASGKGLRKVLLDIANYQCSE